MGCVCSLFIFVCLFHAIQFDIQFLSLTLCLSVGSDDCSVGGDRKMLCIGGTVLSMYVYIYYMYV